MQCYAVLCYAVVCSGVLCSAMQWCAILCYAVVCRPVLCIPPPLELVVLVPELSIVVVGVVANNVVKLCTDQAY